MAVHIFKDAHNKLDENTISDFYAMYLHTFVGGCGNDALVSNRKSSAIMLYDEFKEYYILKILGRSAEFTQNIARDYQYLSFDNWSPSVGLSN